MSELEKMSLVELRIEGRKLGVKNITSYKKQELLEKLLEMEKAASTDNVGVEDDDSDSSKIKKVKKPERIKKSNINTEQQSSQSQSDMEQLDSGEVREGILEVMQEGYGFIRCDNYLPGDEDVYVSPALIRKYHLRTGDILRGNVRVRNQNEKFGALLYIRSVNGVLPDKIIHRVKFEQLTPVFPNERIRLEMQGGPVSMRMMDLISPIGKGQRGMIVSQPKTGKTTLLKQVAKAVKTNHPKMHLIVLLIDERPEEVTDIKESIMGHNVDVIYSTFDELPENHKRVSEMVIERAKRLVEHGEDVMVLLDSITRLARAYNLTVQPSGRTLSGGLDPAALHMPKRFLERLEICVRAEVLQYLQRHLSIQAVRWTTLYLKSLKAQAIWKLYLTENFLKRGYFQPLICQSQVQGVMTCFLHRMKQRQTSL